MEREAYVPRSTLRVPAGQLCVYGRPKGRLSHDELMRRNSQLAKLARGAQGCAMERSERVGESCLASPRRRRQSILARTSAGPQLLALWHVGCRQRID